MKSTVGIDIVVKVICANVKFCVLFAITDKKSLAFIIHIVNNEKTFVAFIIICCCYDRDKYYICESI